MAARASLFMLLIAALLCSSAFSISSLNQLTQGLTEPAPNTDSNFGMAVAVFGTYAAVTATGSPNASSEGVCYFYTSAAGAANGFVLEDRVTASNAAAGYQFGSSVAIHGTTAVVGSRFAPGGGARRGSAYVFARNANGTWSETHTLTPSGVTENASFGSASAATTDLLLVGAFLSNSPGVQSGAAFIFGRDFGSVNSWNEVASLNRSVNVGGDWFGASVAIDGTVAVVGAPRADRSLGNEGMAFVFSQDEGGSNNWGEIVVLLGSDSTLGDEFGSAVAISGSTIAVGAPKHNGVGAGSDSGAVYLFDKDTNGADQWGALTKIVPASSTGGDEFGSAVSISGALLLAGAPGRTTNESGEGVAFLFVQDLGGASNWGELSLFEENAVAASNDASFGAAVAVEGGSGLVGAPNQFVQKTYAGAVSVLVAPDSPASGAAASSSTLAWLF